VGMLWGNVLLAAGISIAALTASPAKPATKVYRIDLTRDQTAWSQDVPQESGGFVVFHRYPGGLLVSVRKSDVKKITAAALPPEAVLGLRPGKDIVVLGPTGESSTADATKGDARAAASEKGELLPGERKDGSALLNPDRKFRPEWDTKQVPGLNLGYPNSPNDYREGRTFAYPPASAHQEAPGDVPRMPPGNGEPPKGPS
jgi:hypothetical protein